MQIANIGVNRFLKSAYQRECTKFLCSTTYLKRLSTTLNDSDDVIRTILQLGREHKTFVNCFTKCGLLSGYKEVKNHFHTTFFSAGIKIRDGKLPLDTAVYIREVLSRKNLFAARDAPICIFETSLSSLQRSESHYINVAKRYRQLYFSLGLIVIQSSDSCEVTIQNKTQYIRKLNRLGMAENVSRGAPGSVATACGSSASA